MDWISLDDERTESGIMKWPLFGLLYVAQPASQKIRFTKGK